MLMGTPKMDNFACLPRVLWEGLALWSEGCGSCESQVTGFIRSLRTQERSRESGAVLRTSFPNPTQHFSSRTALGAGTPDLDNRPHKLEGSVRGSQLVAQSCTECKAATEAATYVFDIAPGHQYLYINLHMDTRSPRYLLLRLRNRHLSGDHSPTGGCLRRCAEAWQGGGAAL